MADNENGATFYPEGWCVVLPSGRTVVEIGQKVTEDDIWHIALEWPTLSEIDYEKSRGARAFPVKIMPLNEENNMKNQYVVIFSNGKSENVAEKNTYHDILERYSINRSAPFPEVLICNGKIIISYGLWETCIDFVNKKRELIDIAIKNVELLFPEPTHTNLNDGDK